MVSTGQCKRNDILLRAFAEFVKSGDIKDAGLYLVDRGNSPDKDVFKKMIQDLGISDYVVWLKSETIIQNQNARKYFPGISLLSYEESVRQALTELENQQIISRWCDSSADAQCDTKGKDQIDHSVATYKTSLHTSNVPITKIFQTILSLGGTRGWFKYDWLWKLRGIIDKIFGGPGLHRGRRDPYQLRIGDSLDFWKVVDLKKDKRLLLASQMKLPGKAWLEFIIQKNILSLQAHFLPNGIWGRFYWWTTQPVHRIIFPALIRNIIHKAQE